MQKVGYILLFVILTSGCAVFKSNSVIKSNFPEDKSEGQLFENIKSQNLTNAGFSIQKAEIEIKTKEGTQKLLGSIKFEYPDKYLISIKSRTGIEVARIFISNDSILINDRINKKLYYDSFNHVNRKYGISYNEIPMIFGDFFTDPKNGEGEKVDCKNGSMDFNTFLKGRKIKYVIDCKKAKLQEVQIMNSMNEIEMSVDYDKYLKSSMGNTPEVITLNDFNKDIEINIKIRKIEEPWTGKIDFIPGKNYEILQLP